MEDEKERELMKSLCFGIVGDIGQLLSDKGFNKAINFFELVIFAAFIVTDTYIMRKNLVNTDSSITNTQLDRFHLDLFNYVINEYFLKETTVKKSEDILKFREEFYDLIQSRYLEYRPSFAEDISDTLNKKPSTIFGFNTLNKFLKYLFPLPLNETELSHIRVPMSLKLSEFYVGCIQSF